MIVERLTGVLVQPNFDVPRGTVVKTRWGVRLHPSDWMLTRNNGRTPLWSRHMRGVIEVERDQRRRRKNR